MLRDTKGSDEFLHTENMILVDPQGRIRGIYNATLALEIDRVVEDVQELKREAVGPAPRFAAAGQMR